MAGFGMSTDKSWRRLAEEISGSVPLLALEVEASSLTVLSSILSHQHHSSNQLVNSQCLVRTSAQRHVASVFVGGTAHTAVEVSYQSPLQIDLVTYDEPRSDLKPTIDLPQLH